ncbi:AAA family ATPase [Stappia sp. F7233]|jgi:Predicted ATP-dependent endonuclease of the OLD family|uniref:AAA family ATPase n=1 Tax=Stappia albiluteola TaxID=2758565 RepID=A0A839A7Z2_9HYPH|nr:AAA family ATPase [Stappia albiluteola]MBA5775643.1 AAA family ATPase [Stappia albiluteola]
MRVCRLSVANFRGVKAATILLPKHAVLIGDNNTGKTTLLEALDLVLGPDRLNRQPPIDEHDFFRGKYLGAGTEPADAGAEGAGAEANAAQPEAPGDGGADGADGVVAAVGEEAPRIEIEVAIADLTEEQKARFGDYTEFWDAATDTFYEEANPAGVDAAHITEALRVTFHGWYDPEEDDFEGRTYFTRSLAESDNPVPFSKKDKQVCGFLYLRSLRTGSRALSLERGSLLDIILRLKEVRPQMWEDTLATLAGYSVASDPELGISGVLESINTALKKYVPKEWGIEPHLKVSNLTREHLRKVITAFIATGEGSHAAPFYRQGTGTINMLVLAMLSQIAEDKQNVIFAMEEPETAIPPYAQKRIVHEIRKLASQTIFTSHSPYVLEEFALDETVVLGRDANGVLAKRVIALPDSVKPKRYRQEFRTRFCEGLLARRILVAEGATEAAAFPVVCRRLSELKPNTYSSLEALGVCTIDAGSQNSIPDMAKLYRELGRRVFAICDKQEAANKALIEAQVELLLMHDEKGFEDLVLKNTTQEALKRFAKLIDWPPHLTAKYPDLEASATEALRDYFGWTKANWGIADFLAQCSEAEIPAWLREACVAIKDTCAPGPAGGGGEAPVEPGAGADAAH